MKDPVTSDRITSQLERLRRGTAEIVTEDELRRKLARAAATGRPLRVKLGMDPSAPDVHLGHTVVLRKLRQFQDLGHEIHLIIGDFTAQIGDPTGRKATRPQLTREQIQKNAATYAEQVFRVLDPERTRIAHNNDWLGPMSFADVIRLAATYTVARMLEREDFKDRHQSGRPISLHEFLYPLAQAYDSVALQADVELGGTDQKFNLMVARHIQREYGQEPEVAVITPLLVGTDGREKMSKSLGNAIGISEPADSMYGKVMSIPDALIPEYLELLTEVPKGEIRSLERAMAAGEMNPRDVKMRLAREVVATHHGPGAAEAAEKAFIRVFRERELPEEIPEVRLDRERLRNGNIRLLDLVTGLGMAATNSAARRMIRQGAVRIDGKQLDDETAAVEVRPGMTVQVGRRRFTRVRLDGPPSGSGSPQGE